MQAQQDKYKEVTEAVYELIIVFNGISFNDLMFSLPQFTEGLVQRSISILLQQGGIYESFSNGASRYYASA